MIRKKFENIGEVIFKKLTISKINTLTDFIYDVYQSEGIWLTYTKKDIEKELLSRFTNIVYKPKFYIAILNNEIIGCGSWLWSHTSSNVLELSFGTVHPKYQRIGIGQYLTKIRLKDIINNCNKDSVIVTSSRRPKFFENLILNTLLILLMRMKNHFSCIVK